ncbi:MAG: Wzz/FepE/Etk N-terminal domain-containing protein [Campylobacterota bacterium]|nr:Wzz/FepE/Etk N-terminal domain-containing protein [Campylobacterota bacterium]
MQENIQRYEEDIIDLKELWKSLIERQRMIIAITLVMTTAAIAYVLLTKPIYSGSVMVEVGEVLNNATKNKNDKPIVRFYLDKIHNLKNTVSQSTRVSVKIPKGTTNILELSYMSEDKETIRVKLTSAVEYILNRHKEKAKFYEGDDTKIRMSKVVGEIIVHNEAVKPKKTLIVVVAFITGLMFSVFLAFFLEFVSHTKTKEEEK